MSSELGDFLRARRTDAALDPSPKADVGRRRISRLRREEVAAAAGISVDYYVRLEQGRELRPSDAVIHALARQLHLSDDERRHVFRLRDAMSAPPRDEHTGDLELAARMTALVDAVCLRARRMCSIGEQHGGRQRRGPRPVPRVRRAATG